MTRSVLEGVSFGLRDSLELMKGAGLTDVNQIRATGVGEDAAPRWNFVASATGGLFAEPDKTQSTNGNDKLL